MAKSGGVYLILSNSMGRVALEVKSFFLYLPYQPLSPYPMPLTHSLHGNDAIPPINRVISSLPSTISMPPSIEKVAPVRVIGKSEIRCHGGCSTSSGSKTLSYQCRIPQMDLNDNSIIQHLGSSIPRNRNSHGDPHG